MYCISSAHESASIHLSNSVEAAMRTSVSTQARTTAKRQNRNRRKVGTLIEFIASIYFFILTPYCLSAPQILRSRSGGPLLSCSSAAKHLQRRKHRSLKDDGRALPQCTYILHPFTPSVINRIMEYGEISANTFSKAEICVKINLINTARNRNGTEKT